MLKYMHNFLKTNMSIYQFLQLQPVEPDDDGNSDSDLDAYKPDETIDLKHDVSGQELEAKWDEVLKDFKKDPKKLNFSDSGK